MKKLLAIRSAGVGFLLFALCFFGNIGSAKAASLIGIAGVVTDQTTGVPLENVSVHVAPLLLGLSNVTTTTDVNGYYNIDLLPGLYTVQITPSAASGYTAKSTNNLSLLGAQTINAQLTRPSYTLTGTVTDSQAHTLANMTAHLTDYVGSTYEVTTNSSGVFTQSVLAGQYTITIDGQHAQYFPDGVSVSVQTPLNLTANTSHTFQLPPTTQFTVNAKDSSSTNIANRDVRVSFGYQGTGIASGADAYFPAGNGQTVTTNSSGNALIRVFLGMTATQGAVCMKMNLVDFDVCNATAVTVSNVLSSLNLQEPPMKTLSGRIVDASGNGVSDLTVLVNNYNFGSSTVTNSQGYYSISLPAAGYTISFYMEQGQLSSMLTPVSSGITLTTNQTRDFSLPQFTSVNATIKDENGGLLADQGLYMSLVTPDNVSIQSTTDYYNITSTGTVMTNASGVASFVLFQGLNSLGGDMSTYLPSIDAMVANTSPATLSGNIVIQFHP